MEPVDLPGRAIDDVPFTGLVESLTIINLIGATAVETGEHLTKEDLLSFVTQMRDEAVKAIVFSGATRAEARKMSEHLLSGMSVQRKDGGPDADL